ncbi:hypothetical protein [Budvicia aquatica]|uniref:hypothetical protein n=1 Tax=Budvicia aquatica TaxID=82979 RepID=UPI002101455A|nr:hypothetical protein [Budvicia aquatica]
MISRSLRTRLVVIFTLLLVLAWAISSAISYVKVRHRVRLIFDSEQIMFAQRFRTLESHRPAEDFTGKR